ncbi:hypothetical protein O181_060735 [Austropuccinia psidii MF-1]|uniref:Uncharacterized protein n=1 Tax=Austropuccinia psidii MF-1 TaxID=1389203 RepID=A0A9Q3HZV5_9BASI|nr:hypothetical protein [Austropuccinia psidii MF-1]
MKFSILFENEKFQKPPSQGFQESTGSLESPGSLESLAYSDHDEDHIRDEGGYRPELAESSESKDSSSRHDHRRHLNLMDNSISSLTLNHKILTPISKLNSRNSSSMFKSKSSNQIFNSIDHQCKTKKSILKRSNSPSKPTRARFFSPRLNSSQSNDSFDFIDQNGNLKAREIIHEFQSDQPPCQSHHLLIDSPKSPNKPFNNISSNPACFASPSIKTSHSLKFTIPEPDILPIEPILPIRSTSPTFSPDSSPLSQNLKANHSISKNSTTNLIDSSCLKSSTNSFLLNQTENISNILDESGGFLLGNDTSNWINSTEQSIDSNHTAILEILEKRNISIGNNQAKSVEPNQLKALQNLKSTSSIQPDETSLSVDALAKQLEKATNNSNDYLALKDEPAPINFNGSLDLSTTFEISKINVSPLLTHQEQIWKNSMPKHTFTSLSTPKPNSHRSLPNQLPDSIPTAKSFKKIINSKENHPLKKLVMDQSTTNQFATSDNLLEELMGSSIKPSIILNDPLDDFKSSSKKIPSQSILSSRPISTCKSSAIKSTLDSLDGNPRIGKSAGTTPFIQPVPSSRLVRSKRSSIASAVETLDGFTAVNKSACTTTLSQPVLSSLPMRTRRLSITSGIGTVTGPTGGGKPASTTALNQPVLSSRPTMTRRLSVPTAVAQPPLNRLTFPASAAKPRSSIATTPLVRQRHSHLGKVGIGLGLPSTGVKTKLKPSTALETSNGSPRVMKSRSSTSIASMNSPKTNTKIVTAARVQANSPITNRKVYHQKADRLNEMLPKSKSEPIIFKSALPKSSSPVSIRNTTSTIPVKSKLPSKEARTFIIKKG